MFKRHFFILTLLALTGSGCITAGIVTKKIDWSEKPVCLSDCDQISVAIEKYRETHDLVTEDDKIDYLLSRIRFSNSTFVRNGEEVDPGAAADFLRQKIGWFEKRHRKKIDEAKKFVTWVIQGSETTGQPYTIILPDESKHNMQFVMQNELNHLDAYQGKRPEIPTSDKTTP